MSLASWNVASVYEADVICCPLRYVLEFFHLMPRNAGLRNVNGLRGNRVSKYFDWLPSIKRRSMKSPRWRPTGARVSAADAIEQH